MDATSHLMQAPPSPPTERLVERLAEKIGSSARAAAVFGEAVGRDGVTVIPVAKARWGFGGGDGGPGGGRRPGRVRRGDDGGRAAAAPAPQERAESRPIEGRDAAGWGGGGGGGVQITPVGFIEMTPTGARFRRIVDQNAVIALGAMALVAAGIAWRVAARLDR
jgi:uncharacterized spore protein YtfJ